MWPHEESLAEEPIVVRGASIEEAARTAQDLIGRPVKVVKADRIRRGGIAGFFATDLGVEVTVVPVSNVAYDRPTVSFAEAFERLMEEASIGDQHEGPAPEPPDQAEASAATAPIMPVVLPVPAPLVVVPERRPVVGADIDGESCAEAAKAAECRDDVSVVPEPLEELAPQPAVEVPLAPPVVPAPDAAVTAPPPLVAPTQVPVPASTVPTEPLPPMQPIASLPAPVLLTADHGRMARDVAESMIAHLGEHGTVSVSVRISLADGSELRADARAGSRH